MTFLEAAAQIHPAFFILMGLGLTCCLAMFFVISGEWSRGRSTAGLVLLLAGVTMILAGIPVGILSA